MKFFGENFSHYLSREERFLDAIRQIYLKTQRTRGKALVRRMVVEQIKEFHSSLGN